MSFYLAQNRNVQTKNLLYFLDNLLVLNYCVPTPYDMIDGLSTKIMFDNANDIVAFKEGLQHHLSQFKNILDVQVEVQKQEPNALFVSIAQGGLRDFIETEIKAAQIIDKEIFRLTKLFSCRHTSKKSSIQVLINQFTFLHYEKSLDSFYDGFLIKLEIPKKQLTKKLRKKVYDKTGHPYLYRTRTLPLNEERVVWSLKFIPSKRRRFFSTEIAPLLVLEKELLKILKKYKIDYKIMSLENESLFERYQRPMILFYLHENKKCAECKFSINNQDDVNLFEPRLKDLFYRFSHLEISFSREGKFYSFSVSLDPSDANLENTMRELVGFDSEVARNIIGMDVDFPELEPLYTKM